MRGYRGLFRELSRTRGGAALWLQLRGGFLHLLRGLAGAARGGGAEHFRRNYEADGFAVPREGERELARAAQRCLVCGMCSLECARVGGAPPVDPQEGVVATSRLRAEAIRLGAPPLDASPCAGCRACERVCPVRIPIADVLEQLAAPPSENRVDSAARIK